MSGRSLSYLPISAASSFTSLITASGRSFWISCPESGDHLLTGSAGQPYPVPPQRLQHTLVSASFLRPEAAAEQLDRTIDGLPVKAVQTLGLAVELTQVGAAEADHSQPPDDRRGTGRLTLHGLPVARMRRIQ
jgi:hypothetical protein